MRVNSMAYEVTGVFAFTPHLSAPRCARTLTRLLVVHRVTHTHTHTPYISRLFVCMPLFASIVRQMHRFGSSLFTTRSLCISIVSISLVERFYSHATCLSVICRRKLIILRVCDVVKQRRTLAMACIWLDRQDWSNGIELSVWFGSFLAECIYDLSRSISRSIKELFSLCLSLWWSAKRRCVGYVLMIYTTFLKNGSFPTLVLNGQALI